MSELIAITGPAGAGKDTAADALLDHGFRRYGFADPIKTALNAAAVSLPYPDLGEGTTSKSSGCSPTRSVLQMELY